MRLGSGLDYNAMHRSNYSVLGSSMAGGRMITAERMRQQQWQQGSPSARGPAPSGGSNGSGNGHGGAAAAAAPPPPSDGWSVDGSEGGASRKGAP